MQPCRSHPALLLDMIGQECYRVVKARGKIVNTTKGTLDSVRTGNGFTWNGKYEKIDNWFDLFFATLDDPEVVEFLAGQAAQAAEREAYAQTPEAKAEAARLHVENWMNSHEVKPEEVRGLVAALAPFGYVPLEVGL